MIAWRCLWHGHLWIQFTEGPLLRLRCMRCLRETSGWWLLPPPPSTPTYPHLVIGNQHARRIRT